MNSEQTATCQSLLGGQEESNEYPNRMYFSLNLFFWLSHLMTLAEKRRVALENNKSISRTDTSVLVDCTEHQGTWADIQKENTNLC